MYINNLETMSQSKKINVVFNSRHLYVPHMEQEFLAHIVFYLIGQLSIILLFAIWYLMFEFTGIIRAIIIFSAMVIMLLFSLLYVERN